MSGLDASQEAFLQGLLEAFDPGAGQALGAPTESGSAVASDEEENSGVAGEGAPGGSEGGGPMAVARARYSREQFLFIRDRIVGSLCYPPVARRRGWEGQVVLSFVVDRDGSVRDVAVLESSGKALLDRSAMKAVRKAAPFPRPPVAVEVKIPISFRLT